MQGRILYQLIDVVMMTLKQVDFIKEDDFRTSKRVAWPHFSAVPKIHSETWNSKSDEQGFVDDVGKKHIKIP